MIEGSRTLPALARVLPPEAVRWTVLGLLCAATPAVSVLFGVEGHLSVDEGVYHMMARALSEHGSLLVWNGYREFPSPELGLQSLHPHDGGLAPQYPYLSTVLALPFYRLVGYQGLVILNSLAFLGVVGLTFQIARGLFAELRLALNACLILVLATYAWQYSQAAWPHALAMLFVTGAVACAVAALRAPGPRRSLAWAAAAGLVAGFGTGVRLDAVFALPAVLLPFVFLHPWRPGHALAVCLGTIPGLGVLAATNAVKFGVASPFTYGGAGGLAAGVAPYLPVAAMGLAVVAAAWIASRPRARSLIRSRRGAAVAAAAALLLGLGLAALGWSTVVRLASGGAQILVDLRLRDPGLMEDGLTRGPGGGMIYLGAVKKALLQSCPYLVALALPLAAFWRGGADRAGLGVLFLGVLGFTGVYGYFAWHGGLSLNLRYFVPILPCTSVLIAYAWRELAAELPRAWRLAVPFAGAATFVLYQKLVLGREMTLEAQEFAFLTVPLVIALALAVALLPCLLWRDGTAAVWRGTAALGLMVGLVWAGMVALTYDFPRSYGVRAERAAFARELAPSIRPDSIVFVENSDWFFGLLEAERVRLATPRHDDFRDFSALVDFHLDAGRGVYLWLDPVLEQDLAERGLLDPRATVTLHEHRLGRLVQVTKP